MKAMITYLGTLTLLLLALTPLVQAGPALIVEGEGVGECPLNATFSPCIGEYEVLIDGVMREVHTTSINAGETPGLHPPIFNLQSDGHVLHTNYPTCWDFDFPFDSCVCNIADENGACADTATDVSCTGEGDCISTATRFIDKTKCGAEGADFVEEFCFVLTFATREPISGGTGAFDGAEGQFHRIGEGESDFVDPFIFSSSLRGVIRVK